jgi:hypothetical protein
VVKNGDILYLGREFPIICGEVIAASNFAKWKTRLQIIATVRAGFMFLKLI